MRPFHRRLLWISALLTGLTGVVYWWMKHLMEPVDPWAVINHPLQPWVLKAHILVAPVLVFALGLVATDHIWKHLKGAVRAGRVSGVVSLGIFAPMVLSGYLVQAVTHPGWLTAIVWTHIATGTVFLAGMALHQRATGRARVAARSSALALAVLAVATLILVAAS